MTMLEGNANEKDKGKYVVCVCTEMLSMVQWLSGGTYSV